MSDQLRERFDALRTVADNNAGGLRDVHARRARRTRTRVATASAATVAALALGGVLVFPHVAENSTTSAAGGQAQRDAGGDQGTDNDEMAAEQAPPQDASTGPLSLTFDSLLTAPELAALGELDPQPQGDDPVPVFPPMCGAATASEQYSNPLSEVAVLHAVSDATVSQYAAEYGSDIAAVEAMDRLLSDALSCRDPNVMSGLSVTSRVPGAEIVLSLVEPTAGPEGGPRFTDITILRAANVVVEVAFLPVALSGLGDGSERSRTVADAVVAKL
ncbi:MAG: hypothetical protein M3400_01495 [Actinomycetota bacterium]|nr:hypothetical protein [Actinomycetota bacterium]